MLFIVVVPFRESRTEVFPRPKPVASNLTTLEYGPLPLPAASPEMWLTFKPTFSNLLLTCRQLRTETLERQARVQIPYALDMLIVNGKDLWLTWISIPLQRSYVIESLEVNIRVSGALRDSDIERGLALDSHHFSYLVIRLLMRILSRGASGPIPSGKMEDAFTRTDIDYLLFHSHWELYYTPHYCIRKLDVNFNEEVIKDIDEVVAHPDADFEELRDSRTKDEPFYIQHPDSYRTTLYYELSSFFNPYGTASGYPHLRVLRERVGGATISYAGAIKTDWSRLSEAFEDSGYLRIGYWSKDMRDVVDVREKHGIHEKHRTRIRKSNLI
jgi:hypothetical protein